MEHGSPGASDVVDGKRELFFSEVIPLGFTKLYLLFVCFVSLCPATDFSIVFGWVFLC